MISKNKKEEELSKLIADESSKKAKLYRSELHCFQNLILNRLNNQHPESEFATASSFGSCIEDSTLSAQSSTDDENGEEEESTEEEEGASETEVKKTVSPEKKKTRPTPISRVQDKNN